MQDVGATAAARLSRARSTNVSKASEEPPTTRIDSRLEYIRNDPEDFLFQEFMFQLYRDMLFWVEAEKYKSNPRDPRAASMWQTFFSQGGEYRLDSTKFPGSEQTLFTSQPAAPSKDTFNDAQTSIYNDIKKRLYQVFKASTIYAALEGQMEQAKTNPRALADPFLQATHSSMTQLLTLPRAPVAPTQSPPATARPPTQAFGVLPPAPASPPPPRPVPSPVQVGSLPNTHSLQYGLPRPTPGSQQPSNQSNMPLFGSASRADNNQIGSELERKAQFEQVPTGKRTQTLYVSSSSSEIEVETEEPTIASDPLPLADLSRPNRQPQMPQHPPPNLSNLQQPIFGSSPAPTPKRRATADVDEQVRLQMQQLEELAQQMEDIQTLPTPTLNTSTNSAPAALSPTPSSSGHVSPNMSTASSPGISPPGSPRAMSPARLRPMSPPVGIPSGSQPLNIAPTSSPVLFSISGSPGGSRLTQYSGQFSAPVSPLNPPTGTSPFNTNGSGVGTRDTLFKSTPSTRSTVTSNRDTLTKNNSTSRLEKMATITGLKKDKKFKLDIKPSWMRLSDPHLQDSIMDSHFMACFLDYLRTTHAEEILACWLEIELYKSSPQTERGAKGKDIVDKYFNSNSASAISLERMNYAELLRQVQMRPDRDLFEFYQAQLWDLLSLQCLPKFKDSDLYKRGWVDHNVFRKKHKEMVKGKEYKSTRAGVVLATLDEYLAAATRSVSITPNVSESEFQLEDILYSQELMCAYRDFVNTIPDASQYLAFWFEVEVSKYSSEKELKERAEHIVINYFMNNAVSFPDLDLADMQREVAERPNKNTFVVSQARSWELLQDAFAQFRASDMFVRFFEGSLPVRQASLVLKLYEQLARIRDAICQKDAYSTNLARVISKMKSKKLQLHGTVDLETVVVDQELFFSFKEFLVKKQALENLHFWIEAENYKYVPAHERRDKASQLWSTYLDENSKLYINVDVADKQRLRDFLVRTSEPLEQTIFQSCQDHIWSMLSFDMLPKYVASDTYKKLVAKQLKAKKEFRNRTINRETVMLMLRWLNEK